jgi:hypothetical protein
MLKQTDATMNGFSIQTFYFIHTSRTSELGKLWLTGRTDAKINCFQPSTYVLQNELLTDFNYLLSLHLLVILVFCIEKNSLLIHGQAHADNQKVYYFLGILILWNGQNCFIAVYSVVG